MVRRLAALLATCVAALAVVLAPLEAAPPRDYATSAWTILPPGENGSVAFDKNTRDQAQLYDALTPRLGNVTARDIRRLFKPAPLGAPPLAGYKRESPRPGVKIVRDDFGVAHVNGKTEADVAYGAGWVTAADRGLLLQLIRGPARIAALDVPGLDPLALALSGKSFIPSPEAEAFLSNQIDALRAQRGVGPRSRARERLCGRDQRLLLVEGDPGGAIHGERCGCVRRVDRRAFWHERRAGGRERDVPGRAAGSTR